MSVVNLKMRDSEKDFKNYLNDYGLVLAKAHPLPAKLGGYLARALDPPPGTVVMWRGLTRLIDIELVFNMAMQIVDN